MSCYTIYIHDKRYKFASKADFLEWNDLRREYMALLNSHDTTAPAAVEEVLNRKEAIEERGRQHTH